MLHMHRLCLQLMRMKMATSNSYATGSAIIKQNNYADILFLKSSTGGNTGGNSTRYECHFMNYGSNKSLNNTSLRVVFEAEGIIAPGENLPLSGEYTPVIKHRYHCVIVPCRKRFL